MSYTALYRKFRPLSFSEMVGQEHITRTLKNQIIANRVGHAYLFNGSRGTGKTSAAKILARAINCLNPVDGEPCNECEICKGALNGSLTDIVEMDAASNNSVEDIRSIREEVNFLPTKAKYRVYIIDEVHMLSTGAFNALLKTLEEPPEHVKFILATTEPQKLPATILSRCQRFDFKRISDENIVKRLEIVCKESNIEISKEALEIIATLAEGAMRDALSILERCIQDGENNINADKIKDLVGIPKITYIYNIVKSILEYNVEEAFTTVEDVLKDGKDITNLLWEMIKYVKDILVFKSSGKIELYNQEEKSKIEELAKETSKERLIDLIYKLSELENNIKWTAQKTIMFQAGMINLCNNKIVVSEGANINNTSTSVGTSNLEERVSKIENYLRRGVSINNTNNVQVNNNIRMTHNVSNANMSKNNSSSSNSASMGKITKKFSTKSEEYWPQILSELKQNGKIVLYTNLLNTRAVNINDMTVGIEFQKEMTPFCKTLLEKQENLKELTTLVSMACGKEMNLKFINNIENKIVDNGNSIENLANESDIPFNVID